MRTALVVSADDAKFSALALRGDFERHVQLVASLGFEGVELAVRDPGTLDVPRLKKLLNATGLTVPAIGTGRVFGEDGLSFTDPSPEVRTKAMERIKRHVELAAELQAQEVVGLIRGRCSERVPRPEAMKLVEDALAHCASYALARGAMLALEPINRYETDLLNSVAECLPVVRSIGEGIGLLVDTFHMNIEEVDIAESIRSAGKAITHVHFADSNRWAPGCGHIDFGAVVRVLEEIGYNGFVSAEILPRPSPDDAASLAAAHMKSLLGKGSGSPRTSGEVRNGEHD